MRRPDKWYRLPGGLAETLASTCELKLENGCSYCDEYMKLIHTPEKSQVNSEIVQQYYETLSDHQLTQMILIHIDSCQKQIDMLKEILTSTFPWCNITEQ